jgi:superfamily II DNA or RNA helicase
VKVFHRQSPTIITFPELMAEEASQLRTSLSYKDPEVERELKQLLPAHGKRRYVERFGMESYVERLADLRSRLTVSLLQEDENGYYTYSGLVERLRRMGYMGARLPPHPERDSRPYDIRYRPIEPRYYQAEAIERLSEARHAATSLPTGAGKSLIIERLVKAHGRHRAVVMAPSKSIAGQLHTQLEKAFGKASVGMFGDGKKESKKDVVVAIAASLTKVEDGEHRRHFDQTSLFIADESHLTPATTNAKVCFDVMRNAADRFFVSATQFRNDGTDLLLEAITGPVVYEKSLLELVDEGFLARPRFLYLESTSPVRTVSKDWHSMVDKHIYSNPKLAQEAAALANKIRDVKKHPVLILVDEVIQFKYLLPHLRHEVGFAHGPLTKDSKDEIDPRFHKSDVDELVERFNAGKLPILVGTSCITTGTDLRPTGTIIYLMSGASEIKFWQAVGRGTRRVDGKDGFNFILFKVNIPDLPDQGNVFARHFKVLHDCCKPFGIRQLVF